MTTRKKPPAVRGDENAAVLNERMRINAIINSTEGKRNPAMANKLALFSQLDAETARELLAEAPVANPYLDAMNREGPIGLSASTFEVSSDPKAARLREISESVAAFNAYHYGKKGGG